MSHQKQRQDSTVQQILNKVDNLEKAIKESVLPPESDAKKKRIVFWSTLLDALGLVIIFLSWAIQNITVSGYQDQLNLQTFYRNNLSSLNTKMDLAESARDIFFDRWLAKYPDSTISDKKFVYEDSVGRYESHLIKTTTKYLVQFCHDGNASRYLMKQMVNLNKCDLSDADFQIEENRYNETRDSIANIAFRKEWYKLQDSAWLYKKWMTGNESMEDLKKVNCYMKRLNKNIDLANCYFLIAYIFGSVCLAGSFVIKNALFRTAM